MRLFDTKTISFIFGGDPRENERRHRANQDLKALADMTDPWTVEALQAAVLEWAKKDYL